MALKYKNSKYLNYPGALQVTSSIPLDIRAVVANEKNLTDAETWYQDCSTATGVKIAYKGMLVSVEENNTVYMCIDPANITDLRLGWKKVNPDLDIAGEMIDVVEYDNKFYDIRNGAGDPWVPNPGAAPIVDPQVQSDGKYLCLVLNDADWVYIKSTNLIDLTDYYTKDQVDDKISILDSSVSGALDDIREYVNTQDDILDEKINALDSSLTLLKEYVDRENDKFNQRIDGIDASITNITNEITEFVNTVEDQFIKIDTSLDNLTNDLVGVHEILDDIETRHETDVERIDEHLNSIDTSIEQLKSVDASLDNKIEDVSARLAELEVGTVDSISTEGDYIHVDASRGDVTFTADVVDSNDKTSFPSRGLVTDGYVEERLDVFNWVEVEDTENPPVESGVQQSSAPIQTKINLATDDNTLAVISTGGDVTIE